MASTIRLAAAAASATSRPLRPRRRQLPHVASISSSAPSISLPPPEDRTLPLLLRNSSSGRLCIRSIAPCWSGPPGGAAATVPMQAATVIITPTFRLGASAGSLYYLPTPKASFSTAAALSSEPPRPQPGGNKKSKRRHLLRGGRQTERASQGGEDATQPVTVAASLEVSDGRGSKRGRQRRRRSRSHEQQQAKKLEKQQKRQKQKQKQKQKQQKQEMQRPTVGENGRAIMTADGTRTRSAALASHRITTRTALNAVHNLRHRMMFQLRTSHRSHRGGGGGGGGGQHDATFVATLRSAFDPGVLPRVPADADVTDAAGAVELCNSGEARTKREATALAAVDLLLQLATECGIDLRDPPDVRRMRKDEERQRFRDEVHGAQMVLELLHGGSGRDRPRLVTDRMEGLGDQFVTEVSMPVDHDGKRLIFVGPPGRSKAESQGLAVVAAAAPGGPLEEMVGRERMESLASVISSSPAGHVASLTVRPLPDEAVDVLSDALGTPEEHDMRMARVEEARAEFERRFHERERAARSKSWRGKDDLSLPSASSPPLGGREQRLLQMMEKEERLRSERAAADPGGPQGTMKSIRDALPIVAIRDDLLDALRTEQVVVISGGTGSGKSTQCPQYILEDAIAGGTAARTRIVVTQPRRIAASSVAERVAAERGEELGNSVGYTVRLGGVPPRSAGSVEFVTTGVLLRRLVGDRTLDGVSHVVIDEVHERDINTDFLMVLLRDLLAERPDLRVLLMSATLDADSFGEYFAGGGGGEASGRRAVPLMSVPAKPRHPVDIIHLEDIAGEDDGREGPDGRTQSETFSSDLQQLASALLREHDQKLQLDLEEAEAEEQAAILLEEMANAEDEGEILVDEREAESDEDDIAMYLSDEETVAARGRSRSRRSTSSRGARSLSRLRTLRQAVAMRKSSVDAPIQIGKKKAAKREVSDITVALVANVAQHVAKIETDAGRKGSVLCFLPGWDEIKAAMTILEGCRPELRKKLIILPLHSTIPKEEQQRIFEPASDGKVKVILATNIAESSVTINDALAIVDSGLIREMNWDAESAMSTMTTVPTSRASATQRTGRAGRVAPGRCYRLYSRGTLQAMPERPMPEIKRTGLENTCLQTCNMTQDGVQRFLSRAMDPPPTETVAFALNRLEKLGAINVIQAGETLTPLGRLLSRLPLDPSTGRMLITGCVMQCLDPVLTAAACFSSRDPFYSPPGMRDEAREIRRSFCGSSDLMATVRAYDTFVDKTQAEGWGVAREWASNNFISVAAMNTISSVKSQLLNELQRIGLVDDRDLERRVKRKKILRQDAIVNQHAGNESLYTAVWATGLPDNLAARRLLGGFGTLRTRMEDHAGLHPSSVAFHRKPPYGRVKLPRWFFYHEMMLSSQVFIRNCTAVSPEQVVLFGGNALKRLDSHATETAALGGDGEESLYPVSQSRRHTVLDDWVVVDSRCSTTLQLLAAVRREIDAALALKVMTPRKSLPDSSQEVVDSVAQSLSILDDRDIPTCTEGSYNLEGRAGEGRTRQERRMRRTKKSVFENWEEFLLK